MTDLVSSTNVSNGHSAAQPRQQITPGSIATTTSGQSNLTAAMQSSGNAVSWTALPQSYDCIAAADRWFSRICQVAPMLPPMWAHL